MTKSTRGCEVCKRPIDPERLESLPDTRLCTEHAIAIVPLGGEFRVTADVERTSKAGSLKLNYGGVSTTKVRNEAAIARLREEFLLES